MYAQLAGSIVQRYAQGSIVQMYAQYSTNVCPANHYIQMYAQLAGRTELNFEYND